MAGEDTGADRYEWERVIRRVRLGAPAKAVALAMATYADRDGTGVRPGVARLSAVTELSERSVRNATSRLREIGLIERVREGSRNGRRALTDEHRLAIPADLLDRVELLDPDETPAPGAADASGTPAPDDTNTGTWFQNTGTSRPDHRHQVHPTNPLPTRDQHTDQRDYETHVTRQQTARANTGAILVPFTNRRGKR